MKFSDTVQRTWRENILFSVILELTYRCNLDCSFCYNDTNLRGSSLSRAEYLHFFNDLRELGTLNLTLSGGEPLAHPEFFALGAAAREMGFVVRIKTNGHALRGRIAQRVRDEIDPFVLEISLHGATAATHDRQTQVPGSFERLIANLEEIKALGLRVRLKTPLTRWNEREIDAMYELADRLELPLEVDTQITGRDNGDQSPKQITPTPEGIARWIAYTDERQARWLREHPQLDADVPAKAPPVEEAKKQCGAGSASVTVDPYGNVYPCVQWRRHIGNLHETSIIDLWQNSAVLGEVRQLTASARETIVRDGFQDAPFCPGIAELETGDPTRVYPAIHVLHDLRRREPAA